MGEDMMTGEVAVEGEEGGEAGAEAAAEAEAGVTAVPDPGAVEIGEAELLRLVDPRPQDVRSGNLELMVVAKAGAGVKVYADNHWLAGPAARRNLRDGSLPLLSRWNKAIDYQSCERPCLWDYGRVNSFQLINLHLPKK